MRKPFANISGRYTEELYSLYRKSKISLPLLVSLSIFFFQKKNNHTSSNSPSCSRLSHLIAEKAIVIVDTGNSMFSAAETMMPRGNSSEDLSASALWPLRSSSRHYIHLPNFLWLYRIHNWRSIRCQQRSTR